MQAVAIYQSTIGKKTVMAITGLMWIGFVVFHMYGNLKVFEGPEYFNAYAEGLREVGTPIFGHLHLLTVARLGLVAAFVLHVWSAWSLTQQARRARPQKYAMSRKVQANYATLTIRWGGLVIFLFVLYHLAHFTWGVPGIHNDFIHGDPYHNLVSGFQSAPIVFIYLITLVALGFHLYHGTWSMMQTLGIVSRSAESQVRAVSLLLAVLIPLGFASVPVSVLLGFVTM